jgi:hypothetical protein
MSRYYQTVTSTLRHRLIPIGGRAMVIPTTRMAVHDASSLVAASLITCAA